MIDCIYAWLGNAGSGEWLMFPLVDKTAKQLEVRLRRNGFVAHSGSTKIGPPEGPPSNDEINEVLNAQR